MPFDHRLSRFVQLATLMGLAASVSPALAVAVFPVGTGPGCGYATIQAAVNAAQAYPGDEDYIYISRSLTYTSQAITIGNQTVELVGGFDTCQDNEPSGKTTISGTGGATEPVFRINAAAGSVITMRNLTISGGDEDGGGSGGGITYVGNGSLLIYASTISNNIAGYGGGIYAEGSGNLAELIIGSDVTISNNIARGSGGGIYVDSMELNMDAPGSILSFNTAQGSIGGGYGGGLMINSDAFGAYAYLGGSGIDGLGLVYANVARYGGGVALVSRYDEERSVLELISVDPARPARVRDNTATVAGGGIYAVAFEQGRSWVRASSALIEDNEAPDGAAAYVNEQGSGIGASADVEMSLSDTAVTGNSTVDENGEPTTGSVLRGENRGFFTLERANIHGNTGGRMIRINGDMFIDVNDSLIVGNQASLDLATAVGLRLSFSDSTIAGNLIGSPNVLSAAATVRLLRSIVWQPGKTTLSSSAGDVDVLDVIASEIASIGGGPEAVMAAPRFVDPTRGDYSLRAASPAVDFAAAIVGDDRDLRDLPRDQDLPIKINGEGPRDIGAYERQSLLPLVLNQDFNVDLNLWPIATANSITWDVSQNVSGGTGSGSAHVMLNDAPQARVIAATQCIHLPGPTLYTLNGWGRSSGAVGFRDTVRLHWEYRVDGGEGCDAGPPTAQGDHVLGTLATWTKPAIPAYVDVPAAQFTGRNSIKIFLEVIDNSVSNDFDVNGWFDGIVLQPDTDVIFRNGFDP